MAHTHAASPHRNNTRHTPIDRHYSHMKFSANEKVLHTDTRTIVSIHLNITHGRRASRPIAPA